MGNGSLPFEPRREVDPENRLGPFIARSEPRTTKRLSSFEQGFISAADAPLSAITVASHAHPPAGLFHEHLFPGSMVFDGSYAIKAH